MDSVGSAARFIRNQTKRHVFQCNHHGTNIRFSIFPVLQTHLGVIAEFQMDAESAAHLLTSIHVPHLFAGKIGRSFFEKRIDRLFMITRFMDHGLIGGRQL